ncbi:DUF3168 domain-containing protein [Pseudodonghicola xiamenensis]|uniref:DUF3168 domain-containing protein n=1 Tax=Pseudodonghicola xiamenensis TaxID=337702 RepID=A0A8J3ME78_9RHOB|nr:DUF3168 domain-containing protein [Pseudodonghicola xiamenensis]GHG87296.1 hypothetical protein GCM10010961_15610 [Pseudodonghicola xiamenensis]
MSYALAGPLQAAIYQVLVADSALDTLVAGAIYDGLPAGPIPETYVSLGAEEVRDSSDKSGAGALHRFTVSVISEAAGFATPKVVAAAVSDALEGVTPSLSRGRLVGLWFEKAVAKRSGSTGQGRQIDLIFRARVEDA